MDQCSADEAECGDGVEDVERTNAAETIGDRAANRASHGTEKGAERSEVSRLHFAEAKLTGEIKHVARGQTDEPAETDGVVETEPVGVLVFQQLPIVREFLSLYLDGSILRPSEVNEE